MGRSAGAMNGMSAIPWETVGIVLGAALAVSLIIVVFRMAHTKGWK